MIIERTNAEFLKLEQPVIERISQLSDFKGQVSKKILVLYSVLDELKEMFKKFTAEQQHKLAKLPVFSHGADFYCNLIKFDVSEIFAQLEKDIKRTQVERDQMLKLKEENVKNLMESMQTCLNSMQTCLKSVQTKSVLTPELVSRLREDSFKTLRELPLFGKTDEAVDFRHPSVADL